MSEVRVGQIWADNDRRVVDRRLRVVSVLEEQGVCRLKDLRSERMVTVKLRRMKPTSTGCPCW